MKGGRLQGIKEEVLSTPGSEEAHIICAAVPNRNRPVAEHHRLSRSAILAKAPWPFSVRFDGPSSLASDLRYLGKGHPGA